MGKATDVEVSNRLVTIYDLLVKSYTYNEIIRYCADKYNISARQADKYIEKATKQIVQNNTDKLESMRAVATTKYMRWIKKAEAADNMMEVRKLQERIDKINGLEIKNINMYTDDESVKKMLEVSKQLKGESNNDKSV